MSAPATDARARARRERWEDLLASRGRPGAPCAVKLCGLNRPADVEAANAAAPDLAGFVVGVAGSRRSVNPARLAELVGLLDRSRTLAVGVFVDLPVAEVACLVAAGLLDVVQLHGHEGPDYLAELRSYVDVPVVRALRLDGAASLERGRESAADLVLFDHGSGGTGRTCDWGLLQGFSARPFVLAGGLGPANVAEAVRRVRPWGVDMSSGIETDGVKDPTKMIAAAAAARSVQL